MIRIHKQGIFLTGYCLWGGLGAYRGIQDYNREYNRKYKYYLENSGYKKKPQYYYLTCFSFSILFISRYLFPISAPYYIINELYNVEKAIRGIEEED
jgi:hypothetical protein